MDVARYRLPAGKEIERAMNAPLSVASAAPSDNAGIRLGDRLMPVRRLVIILVLAACFGVFLSTLTRSEIRASSLRTDLGLCDSGGSRPCP